MRPLGVLLVMLLMLAGQLVAAVGLDALDPQTRDHITPLVLVGLLITMGGGTGRRGRSPRLPTGAVSPESDAPVAGCQS